MPPRRSKSSKAKAKEKSAAQLPEDVLKLILKHLPLNDRLAASSSCKQWWACSLDSALWRELSLVLDNSGSLGLEDKLDSFVSWLIPRKDQVEDLSIDLSEYDEDLDADILHGHLIAAITAVAPTLTHLSLYAAKQMRLTLAAWVGILHHLRYAAFEAPGLELRPGLSRLRQLEALSLGSWDSGLELSEPCLPLSLAHLSLCSCGLRAVPQAVTRLSRLQSLSLMDNPFNPSGVVESFDALRHLTQLKALNLTQCQLDNVPEEVGALSELRVLCLARNFCTADIPRNAAEFDEVQLEEVLSMLPNLEILDLSGCQADGMLEETAPPGLRALALHRNSSEALPMAIATLDRLTWLSLDFEVAFKPAIVEALRGTTSLKELVLVCLRNTVHLIPDSQTEDLTAALSSHPSLTSLLLVDKVPQCTDEGVYRGTSHTTPTLRMLLTLAQQGRVRVVVAEEVEVPGAAEVFGGLISVDVAR